MSKQKKINSKVKVEEKNKEIPLYTFFKIENDIYEIWIKEKGKILFSYPKNITLAELKNSLNHLMGIVDKSISDQMIKEKEEYKKVPIETK